MWLYHSCWYLKHMQPLKTWLCLLVPVSPLMQKESVGPTISIAVWDLLKYPHAQHHQLLAWYRYHSVLVLWGPRSNTQYLLQETPDTSASTIYRLPVLFLLTVFSIAVLHCLGIPMLIHHSSWLLSVYIKISVPWPLQQRIQRETAMGKSPVLYHLKEWPFWNLWEDHLDYRAAALWHCATRLPWRHRSPPNTHPQCWCWYTTKVEAIPSASHAPAAAVQLPPEQLKVLVPPHLISWWVYSVGIVISNHQWPQNPPGTDEEGCYFPRGADWTAQR